jgi:hypothetical protein
LDTKKCLNSRHKWILHQFFNTYNCRIKRYRAKRYASDGFAKIELQNLKVVQNYLKPKYSGVALEIMKENKKHFEEIWDEWFN